MEEAHWAHTRIDAATDRTVSHGLGAHLIGVATRAASLAERFGPDWAYLAGLWHDLGKYRTGFQAYIRLDTDAHIEGKLPKRSDKSHSAAGALHALKTFESRFGRDGAKAARVLADLIAGHHAGLADWTAGLDDRLFGSRTPDSEREYAQALAACASTNAAILPLPTDFDLRRELAAIPGLRSGHPLALCAVGSHAALGAGRRRLPG